MARVDDLVLAALKTLPPKPDESAGQAAKRRYSEQMSAALAPALAEELRHRGMQEARPAWPGELAVAGSAVHADGSTGKARMVVDRDRRVLIGVTFVGQDVAELLHSATIDHQRGLASAAGGLRMLTPPPFRGAVRCGGRSADRSVPDGPVRLGRVRDLRREAAGQSPVDSERVASGR